MAEQDQDTRQREKRVNQTEQHDESVLNPEIKDGWICRRRKDA